ncbi:MAG: hypothetical protein AAF411_03935 [Myxococcota bacterium]
MADPSRRTPMIAVAVLVLLVGFVVGYAFVADYEGTVDRLRSRAASEREPRELEERYAPIGLSDSELADVVERLHAAGESGSPYWLCMANAESASAFRDEAMAHAQSVHEKLIVSFGAWRAPAYAQREARECEEAFRTAVAPATELGLALYDEFGTKLVHASDRIRSALTSATCRDEHDAFVTALQAGEEVADAFRAVARFWPAIAEHNSVRRVMTMCRDPHPSDFDIAADVFAFVTTLSGGERCARGSEEATDVQRALATGHAVILRNGEVGNRNADAYLHCNEAVPGVPDAVAYCAPTLEDFLGQDLQR